MAMEDACVLAEVLRSAATVESALRNYVTRRKPRVKCPAAKYCGGRKFGHAAGHP
jgi:hypothetical protein